MGLNRQRAAKGGRKAGGTPTAKATKPTAPKAKGTAPDKPPRATRASKKSTTAVDDGSVGQHSAVAGTHDTEVCTQLRSSSIIFLMPLDRCLMHLARRETTAPFSRRELTPPLRARLLPPPAPARPRPRVLSSPHTGNGKAEPMGSLQPT